MGMNGDGEDAGAEEWRQDCAEAAEAEGKEEGAKKELMRGRGDGVGEDIAGRG